MLEKRSMITKAGHRPSLVDINYASIRSIGQKPKRHKQKLFKDGRSPESINIKGEGNHSPPTILKILNKGYYFNMHKGHSLAKESK